MEFAIRVTQRDYGAADSMMWRRTALHVIVFGAYIVATILVLATLGFDLLRASSRPLESNAAADLNRSISGLVTSALWLLSGYFLFKVVRFIRQRWEYRKNWNLHEETRWSVTSEGTSVRSKAGGSSYEPWKAYKCWRESRRLFLLIFPSGAYYTLPKHSLSSSEQDELRRIFAAALPKK